MNKTNYFGKIFLGLFLATLLLGFANAATTVAEWRFEGLVSSFLTPNVDITSSAKLEISDSRDYSNVSGTSGQAISIGDWDSEGRYLEISLDSSNYKDLVLRFDERKWGLDIENFSIQYYNGTSFVNLQTNLPLNTTYTSHIFNFSSINFLDDNSNVKLRIVLLGADTTGTWHLDNIKVEATAIGSEPVYDYPQEVQECKDTGNLGGNLIVEIRDISVTKGFGKDNTWQVFDEVEVEFRVKNTGAEYIENIQLTWGVYNTELESWLIDEEESDFDLDSRDTETITVSFKVDDISEIEDAIDEGALDNYIFYVWAQGEDEEYDFDDTCEFDSQDVEIESERDFVVLKEITHDETARCGSRLEISGVVWNTGSRDQEDVSIQIYNKELGINQAVSIGDIDSFSEADLPFSFSYTLPGNLSVKNYQIKYTVLDRRGDIYENSDDKTSVFYSTLKIDACETKPEIRLDASLESQAKAGKTLEIKIMVNNTGSQTRGYSLNLKGYSSWAEMESIEPATFILESNEAKEVLVKLKVNRDAEGEKVLEAEVYSEGEFVYSQPIALAVNPSFSFDLGSWFSQVKLAQNWHIWVIAIVNLTLVVTIIVVAIKVMKK